MSVDCSPYGTVGECAAVGAPTDFKDYCCDGDSSGGGGGGGSVPIVNTCADTLQYLSAYGANSNEICMSMVGNDDFDASKTINLDCGSMGFATVEACLEKDTPIGTAVMRDCCGTPTVDLSSSTCADTNNADLCSGRDGSLNPDKSLSGLNVDCSTFATVGDCVNNGPDSDTFKNHCCEVSNENLPPCAGVGSDKSNCCLDVNSHCAWTGDACVEIENLGGNTDQCGVDDSFPILNTCAETIQYLSAHGSNSNEVCMSMVGQDNFDGSKVIDIGGQSLDCNSGYSSIAECIEGQSVMFDCCGYVPPPPGSVDLSSSTCADTNDPELCSGRDGSLNSDKSLSTMSVDCSPYGTVGECAAVGAPTDFKDYCCDGDSSGGGGGGL